jgi:hypothetical protein
VPYNKDELQDIINNLNLSMSDSVITSDLMSNTRFLNLKPRKGDGSSDLMSDHVVNVGDDF